MENERKIMKISREEKKSEAIIRMKALGIFPDTVKQFKDDGYVSISEPPFGAFFWAEGDDLQRIRDFEDQNNTLVYLVVRSHTNIGKLDSYLYISDCSEEWERDREDIQNMEPLVYVYNHDMPEYSEFGYIAIEKTMAAGLIRTCQEAEIMTDSM